MVNGYVPPINSGTFWSNLTERSVKTFLQVFLVALIGVGTFSEFNLTAAISAAVLATLVSIALAVVGSDLPATGNFWIDSGERAGKTFLGSLASYLAVYSGFLDVPWSDVLWLSLVAAATSLITSLGGQVTVGSPALVK